MSSKTNDNYLCLYVGSIVKNILELHNLLNNRIKSIEEREAEKINEEKMKKAEE